MNQNRMADVTRSLSGFPSRRDVLRGLAGAGFALRIAERPDVAQAGTKRKRKVRRNAFGCINIGGFCNNANQCCSGVCAGRKGRKKCGDHDGGTGCRPGLLEDGCGGTVDVACTTSTGKAGICNTTTGNAGYCTAIGGFSPTPSCNKDADCRALCGTADAACIRCEGAGYCAGPSSGDCSPL